MTVHCGHCGRPVTSAASIAAGFGAECRRRTNHGVPLLVFDDNSWIAELAVNGKRYYAFAGSGRDWITDPRAFAAALRADEALSAALASGNVNVAFDRAEHIVSRYAREELMTG